MSALAYSTSATNSAPATQLHNPNFLKFKQYHNDRLFRITKITSSPLHRLNVSSTNKSHEPNFYKVCQPHYVDVTFDLNVEEHIFRNSAFSRWNTNFTFKKSSAGSMTLNFKLRNSASTRSCHCSLPLTQLPPTQCSLGGTPAHISKGQAPNKRSPAQHPGRRFPK